MLMHTILPILNRRTLLRTSGALALAAGAATVSTILPGLAGGTAAEASPATPAVGVYPFMIGAFQTYSVSDGGGPAPNFPVYPVFTGPAAPKEEVEALPESHFLPRDLARGDINNLPIDTGKNRVPFDTGAAGLMGPLGGHLPSRLAAAGLDPSTIDTVVLSHGHFDHIGGILSAEGKLNYPNATCVMAEDEWAFWAADDVEAKLVAAGVPDGLRSVLLPAARANLAAIKDKITLVKAGVDVVPGVSTVATHGHTPGHVAFRVSSGDLELTNIVDVVHDYVTGMAHPEWTPTADQDPGQAAATRAKLLDQSATDRTLTMAYHFPFPGLGHVARKHSAYEWVPAPWVW
ncbi:MAG: MBL fold metallo-hydrolase [Phenylobacterium sp.]|nr:MBL fold metallo-hydrolase [Phenylobacterium sp.]